MNIKGVFIIDLDGDANVDANFYKNQLNLRKFNSSVNKTTGSLIMQWCIRGRQMAAI